MCVIYRATFSIFFYVFILLKFMVEQPTQFRLFDSMERRITSENITSQTVITFNLLINVPIGSPGNYSCNGAVSRLPGTSQAPYVGGRGDRRGE